MINPLLPFARHTLRAVACCLLASSCSLVAEPSSKAPLAAMVGEMRQAVDARSPYPVLSQQYGESFTLSLAYQVQHALVQEQRVVGYKAGLTTAAGQKKFAVKEPIAGVLLEPPLRYNASPVVIDSTQFNRLMYELELGFILKKRIEKPLASIDELRPLVSAVVPVIELPDLGFEKTPRLLGIDVVATNAAARAVLMGAASDPASVDVNALQVALFESDHRVVEGQGSDASGDQWQALLWLVNHSLKQGYQLDTGHLLITGALGKMMPAKPGTYRADFAELGELHFQIR